METWIMDYGDELIITIGKKEYPPSSLMVIESNNHIIIDIGECCYRLTKKH